LKLFINDNIRSYSRQRGVARCFWQITDGLIRNFQAETTIFSPAGRNYGPAKHFRGVQLDFRGSHRLRLHRVTDKWAEWVANRMGASVFFSPYYGNAHPKAPEIFMVHDMIHALPEYRADETPMAASFRLEVRRCLERAACLIAVSRNTAEDIVKCYPHISPDKIVVIHHGVDAFFFDAAKELPAASHKPFFLFVGNRQGYKNFLRLLQAFGESGLSQAYDLRVISPGPKSFTGTEDRLIRKFAMEKSVHFSGNEDVNLRASYAAAVAFVYPSEYEGFGMPVLEAMAAGSVVAASNRSSIPEVGGEALLYFDPLEVASLSACLRRAADLSSEAREQLRGRGLARAREFTWEQAVQKTVRVMNRFR